MKVEAEEILFMRKNAPKAFPRLIMESLKAKGVDIRRERIHEEVNTLKRSYNPDIISEARRLLKVIKNVEYKP